MDNTQHAQELAGNGQTSELRRATIMMVDDEPLMLEILEMYLVDHGYRNFVAVDKSTEAMGILQAKMPDIVFLDLNMPEVDGFDILRLIREEKTTSHLPVIVLTSSNDAATKLKALELGATDFLEKPIDSSELALRLRNTLTVKAYQDRLAYYDGLTGLPNRTLFFDRLKSSIALAQGAHSGLELMIVSLDQFRDINASLGPLAGDALIVQAAERLDSLVREMEVSGRIGDEEPSKALARMAGGEFSILLPARTGECISKWLGERILSCMEKAFTFEGRHLYTTASIGIASYPRDGEDGDSMIRSAGAANEYAKQLGRNNYQLYSEEISSRANLRLTLISDLHLALQRQELSLHYQPQIESKSGRVVGMEALLRWQHPERGMVPPDVFIPLAEEQGLIVSIGEWVIFEACRQTREWELQGLDELDISVNVSGRQFQQVNFPTLVADALASCGLAPGRLVVELTEGVLMEDVKETATVLDEIKKIGVSLSIDDFGTGYSSMAYLKRFPIDELKIDRSFVMDIPRSVDDTAIVKALVAMAHMLDLLVVAEGVETEAQRNFLRELGCDQIQGYFYSRPLAGREFAEFVRENRRCEKVVSLKKASV